MMPVGDHKLVNYQICFLEENGIDEIFVVVNSTGSKKLVKFLEE